jgi:hypothetical protein
VAGVKHASPFSATRSVAHLAISTLYFNIVDSPVGVVPVTRVDPALDSVTEEWWNDPKGHGTKTFEANVYKGGIYDPVKMKGLPVGALIDHVYLFKQLMDLLSGRRSNRG